MAKKKIIDISPEISSATAVFPGDIPFSQKVSLSFPKGDHLTLSSIETTLHIGAHADAPIHYLANGKGINERSLDYYLGKCQVIRVKLARGERILPMHLKNKKIRASRILFATNSFPNPQKWNSDFNSLSPELIAALARKKVILVGIDTPSIDPWDSKLLESHEMLGKKNMAVLEGIVLTRVPEGIYELAALPLKIKGADASPVRAVLRR